MKRRTIIGLVFCSVLLVGFVGVYWATHFRSIPACCPIVCRGGTYLEVLNRWDEIRVDLTAMKQGSTNDKETDEKLATVLVLLRDTAAMMRGDAPVTNDTLSLAERIEMVLHVLPLEQFLTRKVTALTYLCQEQVLTIQTVIRSDKMSEAQANRLERLIPKDSELTPAMLQRVLQNQSGGTLTVTGEDAYDILLNASVALGMFKDETQHKLRGVLFNSETGTATGQSGTALGRENATKVIRRAIAFLVNESLKALLLGIWQEHGSLPVTSLPPDVHATVERLAPIFRKVIEDGARTEDELQWNIYEVLSGVDFKKEPIASGAFVQLEEFINRTLEYSNEDKAPSLETGDASQLSVNNMHENSQARSICLVDGRPCSALTDVSGKRRRL